MRTRFDYKEYRRGTGAFFIILLALAIQIASCGKKNSGKVADPGIRVNVSQAYRGDMVSAVEVSGDIKAFNSTMLAAKTSGRVVSVPYREGDKVGAGTVVVSQDTSDLNDQVREAEAALLSAKARLSQAQTGEGLNDIQTEAQIKQAKASMEAAKAQLTLIKKGARTQEVASAENAVTSAKANFENAKVNYNRILGLYSDGAVSKQQMDLTQMQYDVASAQYDTAKQQLQIVKEGARTEEIEAVQKRYEEAQQTYRIAVSNRANKAVKREDVKSAKAGVAQAEATLSLARQQVADAMIRTPIAGTVSQRLTEPGQMAGAGAPVMEIVALGLVYFEPAVSEIDIGKITLGQSVHVIVDALPGRTFIGKVVRILPTADIKSRHFKLRVEIPNSAGDLRPGMFAHGSIEVAKHANTIVINKDALISNGDIQNVFAVVDGTARLRRVTIGFQTRDKVEVLSGVSVGDSLVVVGQDKLSDGVKVDVAH